MGELALLTDTTSPVTAIAREPTVLIRISRGLFRKMLEGYPAAAMRLRDEMAGRLGDWTQDLAGVQRRLERGEVIIPSPRARGEMERAYTSNFAVTGTWSEGRSAPR